MAGSALLAEQCTLVQLGGGWSPQVWVTLVIGFVTFVGATTGVILTLRQKTLSDRRTEWWRRASWAVDKTLAGDENAQLVGFEVLAKLQDQETKLITKEDRHIFRDYGLSLLSAALAQEGDTPPANTDNGGNEEAR